LTVLAPSVARIAPPVQAPVPLAQSATAVVRLITLLLSTRPFPRVFVTKAPLEKPRSVEGLVGGEV
jgi:hypothetical protein